MRNTAAILAVTFLFCLAALAQAGQQETYAKDDVRILAGPNIEAQRDSATITWQTNNVAATELRYGTDRNKLDQKEYQAGGSREHTVVLRNLQPGTQYFFEILTNDGVVRNRGQFRTQATTQAGIAAPAEEASGVAEDDVRILEGPDIEEMRDNTAVLTWRTNNIAATHVLYGTNPNNPDKTAYQPGGRREHRVELTELQPGQQYHFQILTRQKEVRTTGHFRFDEEARRDWSRDRRQQREERAARRGQPGISQQEGPGIVTITNGPVMENVDETTVTIAWSTDQRSSSVVRYGTNPNNLDNVAIDRWGTNHRVTLSNLEPGTSYHFQVESSPDGRRGPQTQSARGAFQTQGQGSVAGRPN